MFFKSLSIRFPNLVLFSWLDAIHVVRQKQFTSLMHAKTSEHKMKGKGRLPRRSPSLRTSDFQLPQELYDRKSIENEISVPYLPIEILEAVHHRVRESTDAVLQVWGKVSNEPVIWKVGKTQFVPTHLKGGSTRQWGSCVWFPGCVIFCIADRGSKAEAALEPLTF